jgi:TMEM175 potassium channel family protein
MAGPLRGRLMAATRSPQAARTAHPVRSTRAEGSARSAGRFDPERLAFFSDAVMAIAITILIIDIRAPDLGDRTTEAALEAALRSLTPQFLAFLLSFAVIAIWWNSHHRLFATLAHGDGPLLGLNFIFLASVVFLPLPTAVLGRYTALPAALVLYATTNVVVGTASLTMWWWSRRRGLLRPGLDEEAIKRRMAYTAVPPIVFLVSIPIALVDPGWAPFTWNAVWIALLALRRYWGAPRVVGPGL